jgi:ribonucleoside-diphosphate reductase alpha chain
MFIFPIPFATATQEVHGIPLIRHKPVNEQPYWMTPEGLHTLKHGYLLEGETPWDMYKRVANAVAARLSKPELAPVFFSMMWHGWLGPATPVLSNMGTDRGLPISCNSLFVEDSLHGIFSSVKELSHLSSKGAGVGVYIGDVRGRGELISGGGYSEGVIPWCKVFDSATIATSQGQARRGATAMYLPFRHKDVREFLRMRRPQGDENQRCMNLHHAICIDNQDMHAIESGDPEAKELFTEILKTRKETGEPYLFFTDNVNNPDILPLGYLNNNLTIVLSNLCSEITGYTDPQHTFVCCLSSMNLARWEEWKDTKAIYYAIWFLEGVIQEYIDKASRMVGFENAVRFAEKSRMLGLGVLGYHTLLQQKMIPFESYQARLLNKVIFNKLADETNLASKDLAKIYGEPEWCKGTGLRHTHTLTCAPTVSNSLICGHVSAGIEPLAANCFEKRGAKGVILYYNPIFKQLLANRGKDTPEVWDTIVAAKGSVQHLDFLTDEEKEVFLTAREINQMEIINQAADRQKLMDKHRQGQAQSVNLFFTKDVDETYYTRVHYQAWKKGLKTLYYCRSESASQADLPSRTQASIGKLKEGGAEECLACHG